jgi:flagellar assembly protein FliH
MPFDNSAEQNAASTSAQPFLYASADGESALGNGTDSSAPWGVAQVQRANGTPGHLEQSAYNKGLAEAEARSRANFEKALAEVRGQISVALRQFTTQRESYFEKVEVEIVQLALSIARKILHREAQMDPLLLTGVVRVALDTLNDGTMVRLRTNPDEVRFWREYFGQANDILPVPELIGDPSLPSGHCVLETDLGSTHISLETQLKEIEQGFLDLLEQRPRV